MLLDAIADGVDRVDVERFATSFTAPERVLLRDAAAMRVDRGCVIVAPRDRKSTRLNSSHYRTSRMPSSA